MELFPRGGVLLRFSFRENTQRERKDAAAADAFQGRVLAASFSVIFGCPGMSRPQRGAGQNKRSSQGWLSASGKGMLLRNSGHQYLGAPKKTTLNSIGRSSGTRNGVPRYDLRAPIYGDRPRYTSHSFPSQKL